MAQCHKHPESRRNCQYGNDQNNGSSDYFYPMFTQLAFILFHIRFFYRMKSSLVFFRHTNLSFILNLVLAHFGHLKFVRKHKSCVWKIFFSHWSFDIIALFPGCFILFLEAAALLIRKRQILACIDCIRIINPVCLAYFVHHGCCLIYFPADRSQIIPLPHHIVPLF